MSLHTDKPALWASAPDIYTYGGSPNKKNYLGLGIVDPDTDFAAEHVVAISDHLSCVARTAPFAVMTLDTATATFDSYKGQNGSGDGHAPEVAEAQDDDGYSYFEITVPAYFTSEYGNEAAVAISHIQVTGFASGNPCLAYICKLEGNVIGVKMVRPGTTATLHGKIYLTYWVN